MGLFSSIGKISGMMGGSGSQSSKSQSTSGFALLPPEIQKAFTGYAGDLTNLFGGGKANSMFTPMAQTADETAAFDMARTGLAPTEDSLRRDLQMLMNPYNDMVINEINREATGQNSLVNQAATQAGQQGSNRSFLGTSDVEQNRLNNVGLFRQSQYQNAIDNILGPIANLRQQDIGNLLGIGSFQRGLDMQTRQAPYSAMQAYGGLLGALPQSGGSQMTQSSQQQGESGGLGGLLQTAGNIGGAIKAGGGILGALGAFSDIRLKTNIERIGEEKGFPIYRFQYINMPEKTYIGVMAQDVLNIDPLAVHMDEESGYYKVDYDKIGIQLREVTLDG